MLADIVTIPWTRLSLALLPALAVVAVLWRWSLGPRSATYALARMLVQLLLIGYALAAIFRTDHWSVVVGVMAVMITAAGWIAMRTVKARTWRLYARASGAIALGGGLTLLIATQGVLALDPWFEAETVVPLAGMTFANAMNAVSLAAERYQSECGGGAAPTQARDTALQAALIPTVNSLLAVGLVAIPGMMTGQVLSGVDPLIAARYQIMVMAMVFASAGLSAACFLWLTVRSAHEEA